MKNKRKKKETQKEEVRDPLGTLHEAIRNLVNFADENENAHVANVRNLDIEDGQVVVSEQSHIESTIDLTRNFIKGIFTKGISKNIKKEKVQRKLLESIQFLKTHYRIIHKLKKGSNEEKRLANWALDSIQRYNKLIHKSKETPQSLKERVANFVYRQSGLTIDEELKSNTIDIPHEYSMVLVSESDTGSKEKPSSKSTSEKVSSLLPKLSIKKLKPTRPEIDILRMKSLSLAKNNPNFPASLKKTLRTMVWDTPVEITPHSAETTGESLVHLEQTFQPLPGEVIKVIGTFKRDSKSHVPSVPIPHSFYLSTHAFQTGFPSPLQHTGITFSEQLIPDNPLRLDLLPHFQKLFKDKQRFAEDLLPEGKYNERAKLLLHLKSTIFNELRNEILKLHQRLMHAFIDSAELTETHSENCHHTIDEFFVYLKTTQSPLENLAEIHALINEIFIQNPFEALYEKRIDISSEAFEKMEYKEKLLTCLEDIEDSISVSAGDIQDLVKQMGDDSSWQIQYVLEIGKVLGSAAKSLFLQQFSEKIGFPPPLLNEFDTESTDVYFYADEDVPSRARKQR